MNGTNEFMESRNRTKIRKSKFVHVYVHVVVNLNQRDMHAWLEKVNM